MSKQPVKTDVCNVAYATGVIGGKWKIAIIWKLIPGSLRFSELRAQLGAISEGVLINQLKELVVDGVVRRIDFRKVPPHVAYELTAQGKELEQALNLIESWGELRRSNRLRDEASSTGIVGLVPG